jgi:uncharacterized paraquat-inducible protein A
MKTIILVLAILFASATSFAQTTDTVKHVRKHTTVGKKYTCTMHPEVVRNKPGKCPKCGMKLTAMRTKKTTTTTTKKAEM